MRRSPRAMPPALPSSMREVLAQDRGSVAALAGLAQLCAAPAPIEQAKQTLALVPEAKHNDPAVAAARAALELVEQAKSVGPIGELEKNVAANPLDHQARFDLAVALEQQRTPPGSGRQPDRYRQARSQMERRRRPQAARPVFRGPGARKPDEATVVRCCIGLSVDPVAPMSERSECRSLAPNAHDTNLPDPLIRGVPVRPARCCCRADRCRSIFRAALRCDDRRRAAFGRSG